ncbi:unnamed protein product [Porites evermanni]|uniref:G-protein coupled receptors family 1 profile domain-containing protein n=1 Tax=Porites evermanni TaxID=104178 RepID=A0ABN8LM94_9CNID|nr:unnamed protein product [Porites evermanni]
MDEIYNLAYTLFYSSIPFLVIGFIGNVLVVRIVHKTREMHTLTNYLLVSMATSDIITILLWPLYFFEVWKFVCKLVVLVELCIMASYLTITVLAVKRYHALLKPFRNGLRLREDNVKKAIACIWVGSILICLPETFFKEWSETRETCIGPWTLYLNQGSKDCVVLNVVVSFVQLSIIMYCYGTLIRGLYFANTVCVETDGERRSEKKKRVITFMLVTFGFFVGYSPTLVSYVIIPSGDGTTDVGFYAQLTAVADFIFSVSLCFNPFIYAFRSTNFKEGFKRVILCRNRQRNNEVAQRSIRTISSV